MTIIAAVAIIPLLLLSMSALTADVVGVQYPGDVPKWKLVALLIADATCALFLACFIGLHFV